MTDVKSKHYKKISVKAYAKLINKSDKTVYKMIKDGFIVAKKEKKGYVINVDGFMFERCEDIDEHLHTMRELMKSFELRLAKVEEKNPAKKSPTKKMVLKKNTKPLKKTLKKSVKKSPIKTVKKANKRLKKVL